MKLKLAATFGLVALVSGNTVEHRGILVASNGPFNSVVGPMRPDKLSSIVHQPSATATRSREHAFDTKGGVPKYESRTELLHLHDPTPAVKAIVPDLHSMPGPVIPENMPEVEAHTVKLNKAPFFPTMPGPVVVNNVPEVEADSVKPNWASMISLIPREARRLPKWYLDGRKRPQNSSEEQILTRRSWNGTIANATNACATGSASASACAATSTGAFNASTYGNSFFSTYSSAATTHQNVAGLAVVLSILLGTVIIL